MSDMPPVPWGRILVAAPSEAALIGMLPLAERLVAEGRARLTFLLTLPALPDLERVASLAQRPAGELDARRREEHRSRVRAHLDGLTAPDDVALEVRTGELFLETIRLVEAQGFDLVVKPAERRSRPGLERIADAFRASTDQHLLRKCPAPVWLVEGDLRQPPARVLAAIDVDLEAASEPDTLVALNARIREQLLGFVALGAEEIVLLHAWEAPGEGLLRRWMPADEVDGALAAYLGDIERGRRRALEQFGEALRVEIAARECRCVVRLRLQRGSARMVVPEVVRRDRPDLLLLGTVGRSGVRGLLIGNTAEDVLNAVEGSLFAVKPPGFVCPLELS
ncbi:MAG: universal stress protein [Pseudomonadales bacterium]|jgi:nucleotide-binding universal stress UspA family protein|nr:universal stress protein [Pseudomonadales bacterium]